MRERWNTLPPEVQQEVLRREREINVGLQTAADARKFHEEFSKVAGPYQQYLQTFANGNPLEAFGNYLRTATLLRTGSPQEKANAVAAAIREYGIDVTILDTALAAQLKGQPYAPPQGQPGGHQPQPFRDPRVDDMLRMREEEMTAAMSEELETFANDPKNEFYQDVRADMADWLEFNAGRGRKVTLQQAYDYAVKNSESVQATLATRKTEAARNAGAQRVAAARQAATGGPGRAAPASGQPPAKRGESMRDDILGAIDTLTPAD